MDTALIEKIIEDISEPIVLEMGYELIDVEFVEETAEDEDEEGNSWYLRVYIDKTGGIELDDCAKVSRVLSDKIDEIDPIESSYYFEVSSPGVNRELKKDRDFVRLKGHNIKVHLSKSLEGKKLYKGVLEGLEDGRILIDIDGTILRIPKEFAESVNLNDV